MANKSKASAIKPVKAWAILTDSNLFARIVVCDSEKFIWRKVCDYYDMSQEALEQMGFRCIRVTITPE